MNHSPDMVPQVYRVEEAARILKVGRSTLYRRIAAGKVPHRHLDGVGVRMTDDDLRAYLDRSARPVITR